MNQQSRRPRAARTIVAVLSAGSLTLAGLAGLAAAATSASAAESGTLEAGRLASSAAGPIDYTVYLPPGYEDATEEYASVYLLHGRGDTQAAWQRVATDLDEMIAEGTIEPMVVVMPDAPWNERGSWYTDSAYTGTAGGGPGTQVETAFSQDLVEHIDATYRTVEDRAARAVGGYSMGGAGALRLALAHQDVFSAGLILSAAVYDPEPPQDSSARDYGAYGVGDALYDSARYIELSHPTALAAVDPALPVHLFIAVGDDEWANPDPAEAIHDLVLESARLYNSARRVPGITAELRVLDGGHSWDVWEPAFREGLTDIAGYLRTTPVAPWDAELVGTAGDDRAGGLVLTGDGDLTWALNTAGTLGETGHEGGLDVVLEQRDDAGAVRWRQTFATAENDRAYGVVAGAEGVTILGGYTRGDLDGAHPAPTADDAFVAAVDASGERLWTTQLGDPLAADRFYAVAADGGGGVFAAGYTSGSAAGGTHAGDKDAVVARVDATGEVQWLQQLGGPGEDKGLALAPAPDGGLYVAGVTGEAMPGGSHAGANDAWIARFDADGARVWLQQYGTAENDQVTGLVTRADGSVVAVGHSRGDLGATSAGDNDAVARAFSPAGEVLWTTQTGSVTDDRGVTGVLGVDGSVLMVGATYGAIGETVGGVDVFTLRIGADGAIGAATQFGSAERDGADEWDDANLFVVAGPDATVAISGVTFGAPAGAINAGGGDIFLTRQAFPASYDGGPAVEQPTGATAEPTDPAEGTPGEDTGGDDGGDGAGGVGGDGGPGAVIGLGAPGGLASTGTAVLLALGMALALTTLGLAVRRTRSQAGLNG